LKKIDIIPKYTVTMSNHCLLEKKCLRLALKYELGRSCMCIRVAALVYLTFGTSLVFIMQILESLIVMHYDFFICRLVLHGSELQKFCSGPISLEKSMRVCMKFCFTPYKNQTWIFAKCCFKILFFQEALHYLRYFAFN
jgi:hypothetical protein